MLDVRSRLFQSSETYIQNTVSALRRYDRALIPSYLLRTDAVLFSAVGGCGGERSQAAVTTLGMSDRFSHNHLLRENEAFSVIHA